jgi:dTDP-4-amino-4,6-dideoxygalactose transaminase
VKRTSSTQTSIPFLDLERLNEPLREQILAGIGQLIDRSEFVPGPAVAAFEREFGAYCRATHCVGVASGLDALRLSLQALGIGPGDEVILPANTFVATFEAVSQVGATPVPADVEPLDYNVDPAAVEAATGERTRLLLPVHLYGQLADLDRLSAIARRHSLLMLEDACQAHGATRDGIRAGECSHAAAFSFYPAKNLGAMGDAGAVVTSDATLAGELVMLREHGQRAKYRSERIGWTARLDAIQAVVLSAKLPQLDGWNAERRAVAALYDEALDGVGDLVLPGVAPGSDPVWHLYVIRTAARDELAEALRLRGIHTGLHYPEPPHLSAAYRGLGYGPGSFPVTELLAVEVLSLPIFPGMTEAEVEAVTDAVQEYFVRG